MINLVNLRVNISWMHMYIIVSTFGLRWDSSAESSESPTNMHSLRTASLHLFIVVIFIGHYLAVYTHILQSCILRLSKSHSDVTMKERGKIDLHQTIYNISHQRASERARRLGYVDPTLGDSTGDGPTLCQHTLLSGIYFSGCMILTRNDDTQSPWIPSLV